MTHTHLVFSPLPVPTPVVRISATRSALAVIHPPMADYSWSSALHNGFDGDSAGDKLLREADLLTVGTAEGIGAAAVRAVHDPSTLLKVGGAALAGAAFTGLEVALPDLKPMTLVVSGALTVPFLSDVAGKLGTIGGAMKDAWHSPANFSSDKKRFGDVVGSYAVDTGLMLLGGKLGNIAADRFLIGSSGKYVRIPTLHNDRSASVSDRTLYAKSDPLAELYTQSKDSIVKVISWRPGEDVSAGRGTGFFVSEDGKILTNSHVAGRGSNVVITTSSGENYLAKVLDVDQKHNLSLLYLARETPGKVFRPLKIAQTPLEETLASSETPNLGGEPGEVAAMGYPTIGKWDKLFLSPGNFLDNSSTTDLVRTPLAPSLPHNQNIVIRSAWRRLGMQEPQGKVLAEFDSAGQLTAIKPAAPKARTYYKETSVPAYNFSSHAEEGDSGGPILNMNHEVVAITTRSGHTSLTVSTPSSYIQKFLDRQANKVIKRLPVSQS